MNTRFKIFFAALASLIVLLIFVDLWLLDRSNPGAVERNIGALKEQLGDFKSAEEAYDKAIEKSPRSIKSLNARASFRGRHGNSKGALADYSKCHELDPDNAVFLAKMGDLKQRLGDNESALVDVNKAIELDKNNILAHSVHALIVQNASQNWKAALDDYNVILAIDNYDWFSFFSRGEVNDNLGKKKAALNDLNRAYQLNPTDSNVCAYRGKLLSDLGDKHAAISNLDSAIKLDGASAMAFGYRARVRSDLNDHIGALEDFAKCADITPKYKSFYRGRYETPEPRYKIHSVTTNDLIHGEKQLRTMMEDRPLMRPYVRKDDRVWSWVVREFAGQGCGRRIYWNNKPTQIGSFDYTDNGKMFEIQLGRAKHNDSGNEGEMLWERTICAMYSVRNNEKRREIFESALSGKTNQKGYLGQNLHLSFDANLSTTYFYRNVWLPNAISNGCTATDSVWSLNSDRNYDEWIAAFKYDDYPKYFALEYQRDVLPHLQSRSAYNDHG